MPHDQDRLDHMLQCMYKHILLDKGLDNACKRFTGGFEQVDAVRPETIISDEQFFRYFVNKLAQVCDSERGGATVTALSVLQTVDNVIIFCLGSNSRTGEKLQRTKDFLSDLLRFIGLHPTEMNNKSLKKQVLWKILEFGVLRVVVYLNQINKSLECCIANCREMGGNKTQSLNI